MLLRKCERLLPLIELNRGGNLGYEDTQWWEALQLFSSVEARFHSLRGSFKPYIPFTAISLSILKLNQLAASGTR